ncbi:hypothetical protein ASG96_01220 [Terrabacter sp. Soil810]|jgi:hypothetical protein|nr:hypothetical protein ASD90_21870 [Terrabacter sp. Root181]KRF46689.1 hypothetical protein ASG96_01220 [Terrabacter sp. Soil810]
MIMNVRTATVSLVAFGLLALPVAATASPVPDPPSRQTSDMVQVAIDELTEAYAQARPSDRRGIHNEIVLLTNVGHAAL